MSKRLEVAVFRNGRTVFMKVLHQDDSDRGDTHVTTNKIITSGKVVDSPEIGTTCVYFRGSSLASNHKVAYKTYQSAKVADTVARDIIRIVAARNKDEDIHIEAQPTIGNSYEYAINEHPHIFMDDEGKEVYRYSYS